MEQRISDRPPWLQITVTVIISFKQKKGRRIVMSDTDVYKRQTIPCDPFIYAANSFCVIFNSRRRLSIFADIFSKSIIYFASASAIPSVSHVVSCAFDILSYMLMFQDVYKRQLIWCILFKA